MVEVLIGIVVGYVLALMPKIPVLFTRRQKVVEEKARNPTETEVRKAQRALREYTNFLTYNGDEQEDIRI